MLDCIEELRQAVRDPLGAEYELLRDDVDAYAALCRDANERLRRVGQLLKTGRRSEAIQHAEEEPRLLDLLQSLDFPELEALRELLRDWGKVLPPELDQITAQNLQDAYSELQPLEQLLRRHRLLALARAPLAQRLVILRSLRREDVTNPCWEEDLELLEKARLQELVPAARKLAESGQVDELQALLSELKESPWLQPPASRIVQEIERMTVQVVAADARRELDEVLILLDDAYAAANIRQASDTLAVAERLAGTARLPPSSPQRARMAEVREWLTDHERVRQQQADFEQACLALQTALDGGERNATTLEQLYADVARYEREVPEHLQSRYARITRSVEMSARRRYRLLIVASSAAVLLVVIALVVFVRDRQYRRQVAEAVASVDQLITERRHNQATKLIEGLPARVREHADIAARHQKAQQEHEAELSRRDLFAQTMTQLEAAGPTAYSAVLLENARQLASIDEETHRLKQFESLVVEAQRKEIIAAQEKLAAEIAEVRRRLKALQDNSTASASDLIAEAAAIDQECQRLRRIPTLTAMDSHLLAELDLAARDATAESRRWERFRRQSDAITAITAKVGNAELYSSALKQFAQEFAESTDSVALQSVLQEEPLWRGLTAWSDFYADEFPLDRFPKAPLESLLAVGDRLLVDYGMFASAEFYRDQLKPQWLAMQKRKLDDGRPVLNVLLAEFDKRHMKIGLMYRAEDGRRYYLTSAPDLSETRGQFVPVDHLANLDGDIKKYSLPLRVKDAVGKTPHSEWAMVIPPLLVDTQEKPIAWNQAFLQVIEYLYRQNAASRDPVTEVDPILMLRTLLITSNAAGRGSSQLQFALAPLTMQLALSEQFTDIPSLDWVAPESWKETGITDARSYCRRVLTNLPDIAIIKSRLAEQEKSWRDAYPREQYRWVGWVAPSRADGAQVVLRPDAALPEDAALFVVQPPAGGATARMLAVGRVSANRCGADMPVDMSHLGRPVFVNAPVTP